MRVEKRTFSHWVRRSVMAGLVVSGLVCLTGVELNARISPLKVTSHSNLHAKEQPSSFKRGHLFFAQRKGTLGQIQSEENAQVREWNRMSPEEQNRYQKRYQRLQQMSPKERKRYEKLHRRWEQLPPNKRRQLRNQLQQPENLTPQDLETIRQWFNN